MSEYWRRAARPGCILVLVFLVLLAAMWFISRLSPE